MKYLVAVLLASLLCAPLQAEVIWKLHVTKNNNPQTSKSINLPKDAGRIDLPSVPVKVIVEAPYVTMVPGTDANPKSRLFEARFLSIESVEGTKVLSAAMCEVNVEGFRDYNVLFVERQDLIYQLVLLCETVRKQEKELRGLDE